MSYDDEQSNGQKLMVQIKDTGIKSGVDERQLSEAAYTMSECGMWPDDVSVSPEQLERCWQVVEWLRAQPGKKFPNEFRM